MLPSPLYSIVAFIQYAVILIILYFGIRQFIFSRQGVKINSTYVLPLGALCLIFGFIGLFLSIREAFESIEIAGDVSPQIVARSITDAYDYPILGLIGLALAYFFRFINSSELKVIE